MPNWCENTTTITGDQQQVAKIISDMTYFDENNNQTLSFTKLLPMPVELEDSVSPAPTSPEPNPHWAEMVANGQMTAERYDTLVADNIAKYNKAQDLKAATGYESWYDWQWDNWGIKWGDSDTYIHDTGMGMADLRYNTPWGPFATNFFIKVSTLYPGVTFHTEYSEPGMCFYGVTVVRDGKVLFDEEGKWPEIDMSEDDPEWFSEWMEAMYEAREEMSNRAYQATK